MAQLSVKKLYRTNSRIQILIVLAIFVVINILSSFFYVRFDITQGKDFSISDTTKQIIGQLDDVVTVKAYFTEDLPGRMVPLRQQVDDILAEYESYAHGNININFVDPADDQTLQQEARSLGIPQVQFSQVQQDKYQVSNGYLGIAVMYADENETIPVIQNTATLEYELTNAIKKVTADEELTVAFTTGNGEPDMQQQFSQAVQYLEKQYILTQHDLSGGELVPENVHTLILAGPTEEFDQQERFILDQFLMRGGSVLALIDGTQIEDPLAASTLEIGLADQLANYGIKLNKNLVLDASSDMASFRNGQTSFFTPYPFFVKAVSKNMNQDSVMVNRLESVTLPWVSSIEFTQEANDNIQLIPLLYTTQQAWSQSSNFSLDPQQNFNVPAENRQQFMLAGAKFGQFTSYFSADSLPTKPETEFINSTDQGRLIVVGDSQFVTDNFLRRNSENLVFFSNIVDGLTQDMDLISIRSKSVTDRPLKEIAPTVRQVIKYANIFLPTLIIVIYGFIRSYIRKKETQLHVA